MIQEKLRELLSSVQSSKILYSLFLTLHIKEIRSQRHQSTDMMMLYSFTLKRSKGLLGQEDKVQTSWHSMQRSSCMSPGRMY